MLVIDVVDLISGKSYSITNNSICYFTKEKNIANCYIYYIVLNDGTKISLTHKRWTRIKNQIKNSDT